MSEVYLLEMAIAVFILLLIGLILTIVEFNWHINPLKERLKHQKQNKKQLK